MFNRRILLGLVILSTCVLGVAALAKNSHHHNGHNELGARLHQDGKHELGKHGKNVVLAEVKGHKVVNMSAGDSPVRKVKTNKKMAELDRIRLASNGDFRIAQAAVYYGYCFDYAVVGGVEEDCYWYTADDVLVDETWVFYQV
jgi:hypothetical protein